jgi:hypothetical protein
MQIRKRSKRATAMRALRGYLKVRAVMRLAKTAKAMAKGVVTAKAARSAVKRAPSPKKALPIMAGVGAAGAGAVLVAKKRRHEHDAMAQPQEPVPA